MDGIFSPFNVQRGLLPVSHRDAPKPANVNNAPPTAPQQDLQSAIALASINPATIIFGGTNLLGLNPTSPTGFPPLSFGTSLATLTNTLNTPASISLEQALQAGLNAQSSFLAQFQQNNPLLNLSPSLRNPLQLPGLPDNITPPKAQREDAPTQHQTQNPFALRGFLKKKAVTHTPPPFSRSIQLRRQGLTPTPENLQTPPPESPAPPKQGSLSPQEQAALSVLLRYESLLDSLSDGRLDQELSVDDLLRIANDINSAYTPELKAAAQQLTSNSALIAQLSQGAPGRIRFAAIQALL